MRIGMFTDTWLPTTDGIVTTIERFQESLQKLGHEIFIFAPEDKTGQAPQNDHIFYFKARTFKQYDDYRMAFWPAKGKNEILQKLDIDILHNHGLAFMALKAMFSSRQLKLPILLHFHTWVTDAPQYYPFNIKEEYLKKATWRYLRSLCQRSDGVVAPSETALNELKTKVDNMKYTNWVAPGVDFNRFNPNVKSDWVRDELKLGDSPVIIHVGRVSMEKKLELLFEAMPIIIKQKPDAKMLVVGDGPALDHYKALAKEKKLDNIIFTGFVPNDVLPAYYGCADAFAIASTFETLGIVTVEALACGVPSAGLNYRVTPEIIKPDYNGYLFDDNAKDCAAGILKTLDSPPEMKKNAFDSVQRFDTMECGKKLVGIYEDVMKLHKAKIS